MATDYYSNFIEVERLNSLMSHNVIRALSSLFSRHSIPDVLLSDNGPQLFSAYFKSFSTVWTFIHLTSSLHYPQSIGKEKNAVKTVKSVFKKAGHLDVLNSLLCLNGGIP